MDSRVDLLKEFYRGLPKDRAKVETYRHGFDFLDPLLTDGVELDYGELTLVGLLHKYKLVNIPERRMDELLRSHVEKACNVCLYFGQPQSSIFCFNLDNNHKTNNTELIAEVELTVRSLRDRLAALGCEPLIIASGRGYHVWGRLSGPVENGHLYDFMLRAAVQTMVTLHNAGGYDYRRIKFNFYPDPRTRDTVSLRLFGSEHAKNKVFSRVLTTDGLLDEASSWGHFERYLENRTISEETFKAAHRAVLPDDPPAQTSPAVQVAAHVAKWAQSIARPPKHSG